MPNLFVRAEAVVLKPFARPALVGWAEHGAFWTTLLLVLWVPTFMFGISPDTLDTLMLLVAIPLWMVFGAILFYRWMVRRVLWKVRNRLVVTYLLMGLAPVVLFATLALIAAYVFSGQFATFAASSELDAMLARLSGENQSFAIHIAHVLERTPNADTAELADYDSVNRDIPGELTVDAWSDTRHLRLVSGNRELPHFAAGHPMALPTWSRDGFRGVVLDEGHLYMRAVNTRRVGSHQITFVSSMPLNAVTVDRLAQGLGTINIIPDFRRAVAHFDPDDPSDKAEGGQALIKHRDTVSGGTLAPSAFLFDRRITFSAPLNTVAWDRGTQITSLLSVVSRPALLYAHLFGTAVVVGTWIRYGLITLTLVFAFFELIAFFMAVRLNRTITQAVADLYRATVAIDSGNLAHRIQVQRRDQLGALSLSFNRMSESLGLLLEQQREKERMQSELAIAQEVQANLFPHETVEVPGLELHGVCRPARTVSGDYYDFLVAGTGELTLAMGDISGKGISAALLMASLHSAVRAYRFAGEDCEEDSILQGHTVRPGLVTFSSPGKVLGLLNRHLYRSTQPEKYATLFLAHYNAENRRLVYSNGGQLPPFVLCADGTVRRLDRGGSVVGLLDHMVYEEGEVLLSPGDILVAYSDGVTEPENEFGEFGEERLIELIQRHRHLPLAAISHQLLQSLRAWIGTQEQPDDITVVLARQIEDRKITV